MEEDNLEVPFIIKPFVSPFESKRVHLNLPSCSHLLYNRRIVKGAFL